MALAQDGWGHEGYAHYHRGEAAVIANGVNEATGSSPSAFGDFARDYAEAFTGSDARARR